MFTDAWFTGSLKFTTRTTFLGTPVAPAEGTFDVTTGPGSAVVNDQVRAWASAFPPRSLTPFVTRAVYVVAYALGASKTAAGFLALASLVLLLFGVGMLGARRAGLRGGAALLEAMAAGVFGVLIVVLKAVLH